MNVALYLVSTPIGNWDDITFRALRILKEVDIIVYEENKTGSTLLSHYKITDKVTETLNEHNEISVASKIIRFLKEGKTAALISDCGTPVFADPGKYLVKMAIEQNIEVVPIPGASSIIPALIYSGFPIDEFLYYGFLSQKSHKRKEELRKLKNDERTIVFLETPYRLVPLLKDIADILGANRRLCIPFNITMPNETIYRGTASELLISFSQQKLKGEFVTIVEGYREQRSK